MKRCTLSSRWRGFYSENLQITLFRIRFTFTDGLHKHTHTHTEFESDLPISKSGVKITQGWLLFLSLLFILELWKCEMVPTERRVWLWERCVVIIAPLKKVRCSQQPSSTGRKNSLTTVVTHLFFWKKLLLSRTRFDSVHPQQRPPASNLGALVCIGVTSPSTNYSSFPFKCLAVSCGKSWAKGTFSLLHWEKSLQMPVRVTADVVLSRPALGPSHGLVANKI